MVGGSGRSKPGLIRADRSSGSKVTLDTSCTRWGGGGVPSLQAFPGRCGAVAMAMAGWFCWFCSGRPTPPSPPHGRLLGPPSAPLRERSWSPWRWLEGQRSRREPLGIWDGFDDGTLWSRSVRTGSNRLFVRVHEHRTFVSISPLRTAGETP